MNRTREFVGTGCFSPPYSQVFDYTSTFIGGLDVVPEDNFDSDACRSVYEWEVKRERRPGKNLLLSARDYRHPRFNSTCSGYETNLGKDTLD